MRHVYLDHSATTPVHPKVIAAMTECLEQNWGNPSSIHSVGRKARSLIHTSRTYVANLIGASEEEILFTSSGTEADNLAIIGTALANDNKGKRHIITSSIEHHAILNTCQFLEKKGFKVTYLPVNKYGVIDLCALERAVTNNTLLVSVMHANNEVGTIQPIKDISRIAKRKGAYIHTDAVQSYGKIPININELEVDLLSASAHKVYGPKGIGCLYIRKGTPLHPITFGGNQEKNIRPGTENVVGIVGFGKAAQLVGQTIENETEKVDKLGKSLEEGIISKIDNVIVNGHPDLRLPGHLNICFKNVESEALLSNLDMKGIATSSGAACQSASTQYSHVLLAMGLSEDIIRSSLRITLGRENTKDDICYVIEQLTLIVNRLRYFRTRT